MKRNCLHITSSNLRCCFMALNFQVWKIILLFLRKPFLISQAFLSLSVSGLEDLNSLFPSAYRRLVWSWTTVKFHYSFYASFWSLLRYSNQNCKHRWYPHCTMVYKQRQDSISCFISFLVIISIVLAMLSTSLRGTMTQGRVFKCFQTAIGVQVATTVAGRACFSITVLQIVFLIEMKR